MVRLIAVDHVELATHAKMGTPGGQGCPSDAAFEGGMTAALIDVYRNRLQRASVIEGKIAANLYMTTLSCDHDG